MAFSREPEGRPNLQTTGGYRFPAGLTVSGVTWCYLGAFVAGQGAYLLLGPSGRAAFLGFASTSVANLGRDPVGSLAVSAFVTGGGLLGALTWLPLIAIALEGAVRAAGPWRAVGVVAAGHVVGTLVSEGIVAWRVSTGALPDGYRYLVDVGPSYVVVSSLALALACLPWSRTDRRAWAWRILSVFGLAVLVYPGQIFSGVSRLDVAAVGHVTAIAATLLAAPFVRRRVPSSRRTTGPSLSISPRRRSTLCPPWRRARCAEGRTS